MSAGLLEDNAITQMSDFMGYSLYYIFKFFENLTPGYVILMTVFMIAMVLIVYFRFIKKSMMKVL